MTNSTGSFSRRSLVRVGARGGLVAAVGIGALSARTGVAEQLMTASGAGVNLKLMPDPNGEPVVPMRESFAFDPNYAQCIVEDNAVRFAMDTFGMGRVVIEPHQFFMAMYADNMGLYDIRREANGALTATLLGALFCSTYAGTASTTVGSREAREHARFMIEATDGGFGSDAPPDSFAFTVYFEPGEAPVNHDVFGPEFTFTGEMIAGKITIGPSIGVPVSVATLDAGTPEP